MTLYDRQTLKVAAIFVVRQQGSSARRMLESMSMQGRESPEYEDFCRALAEVEAMLEQHSSDLHECDCERETLGCWWTCPSEARRHCPLHTRALGLNIAA